MWIRRGVAKPIAMIALGVVAGFTLLLSPRLWAVQGPKLGLPPYPLRLVADKPNSIVDGAFTIGNKGDRPLRFKLKPSCGCAELRPESAIIPPGETCVINMGIRVLQPGTERSVRVAVECDDPRLETASYDVFAVCPTPLTLNPRSADFGSVEEGTSPEVRIDILDRIGKPLSANALPTITSESPHVSVRKAVTNAGEMTLIVSLAKDAPLGDIGGRIVLKTNPGGESLEVPVLGRISGPILVVPTTIFLAKESGGKSPSGSTLMVWRRDGRPLGKIVDIASPPGLMVEPIDDVGQRRRFRVRSDGSGAFAESKSVRITFQGVALPIVVSVHPSR